MRKLSSKNEVSLSAQAEAGNDGKIRVLSVLMQYQVTKLDMKGAVPVPLNSFVGQISLSACHWQLRALCRTKADRCNLYGSRWSVWVVNLPLTHLP